MQISHLTYQATCCTKSMWSYW